MKSSLIYTPDHFTVKEIFCSHVANQYGHGSWQFMDGRILKVIDWLREKTGMRIIVNNYGFGGALTQRGFRCNLCQLIADKTKAEKLYLTSHGRGLALDFNVIGMTTIEVWRLLWKHRKELPFRIRIELKFVRNKLGELVPISWIHIDVVPHNSTHPVYFFKP